MEVTMNLNYKETVDFRFDGIEVTVKKYLPFTEKQLLVNRVVNNFFNDEIDLFSEFKKDFSMFLCIIESYTNLEIPEENIYDFYDQVVGSGFYEEIISAIPSREFDYLNEKISDMIYAKQQEAKRENTIEAVVERFLNSVLAKLEQVGEKLPSAAKLKNMLEKSVPKMINSVDPNKLSFIKEAIGFNNGISPNREQRREMAKSDGK